MAIDIGRVRAFVTVVDTGGFISAARVLNIAQPWLSVQIRQLEEQLGYPLLIRSRRTVVELTVEGKLFLPLARRVLQVFEEMIEGSAQIRRVGERLLRLGANPFTLHMSERNRLIAEFQRRCPDVTVQITSADSTTLNMQLTKRELDVIIATGHTPDKFETLPLCSYNFALLIPAESRFASQELIDLPTLSGESVLTVAEDLHPPVIAELTAYLARAGLTVEHTPERSYDAVVRLGQVMRRMVASVDLPAYIKEPPSGMLLKRVKLPHHSRRWHVARLAGLRSPHINRFFAVARELAKEGNKGAP